MVDNAVYRAVMENITLVPFFGLVIYALLSDKAKQNILAKCLYAASSLIVLILFYLSDEPPSWIKMLATALLAYITLTFVARNSTTDSIGELTPQPLATASIGKHTPQAPADIVDSPASEFMLRRCAIASDHLEQDVENGKRYLEEMKKRGRAIEKDGYVPVLPLYTADFQSPPLFRRPENASVKTYPFAELVADIERREHCSAFIDRPGLNLT